METALTREDLEAMRQRLQVARNEVYALAAGKRFCIGIPVQDTDSGVIFTAVFRDLETLLAIVEAQR